MAALSLMALDGSYEGYALPVHEARRHAGSYAVAQRMRLLLGAPDRLTPPLGRIQDPYGFRCVPQIHGPAHDAADAHDEVLTVEINAAAENPLISADDMAAYHQGDFCLAQLAFSLDHFRLAVTQVPACPPPASRRPMNRASPDCARSSRTASPRRRA